MMSFAEMQNVRRTHWYAMQTDPMINAKLDCVAALRHALGDAEWNLGAMAILDCVRRALAEQAALHEKEGNDVRAEWYSAAAEALAYEPLSIVEDND